MSHDLSVTQETDHGDDGAVVGQRIRVTGELDVASAPKLAAVLDDVIDRGAVLVVLDATNLEFVDSSGLRTIIRSGGRLSERGGKLLIEGMSSAMERILEVTGLLDSYRR